MPSSREKVLHLFNFAWLCPLPRGNKQIWLFTSTHSAETEAFSRWGSLVVPDNVGDVAFLRLEKGSRITEVVFTPLGAVTMKGQDVWSLVLL